MKRTISGIMLTLLLLSMLTLSFNIQPVKATGTIYIRADGSIDPPGMPISTIDNVTYTFTGNISDFIVIQRGNIIVDGNGYTLQGSGIGSGFYWSGINNVTIKNTNIKNFKHGINVYSSSLNTFSGNNITANNGNGIWLSHSSNNTMSGNNITNNEYGIYLFDSSYNNLLYNIASDNGWAGIQLGHSSYNRLVNNTVSDNGDKGILLGSSNNNLLSSNIASNTNYGIELSDSSDNMLVGNTASHNSWSGVSLWNSNSNVIYHNNFIDNIGWQAYLPIYPKSYDNTWDNGYPSGGNYWSDYLGVDLNHSGPDGIGDTPYIIDANNQDRYPLVNPWVPRVVGVQVGDWAKYTVETTGYPQGWEPFDITNTEWIKNTVQSISGTTLTIESLWHLKNGTEQAMTGTVDVVTSGYPEPHNMSFWLISKGLNPGATVYATYPYQHLPGCLKINETISQEYLDVSRETNHINITTWWGLYAEFYWDRETGILCEVKQAFSDWSFHFNLVATNLWSAPPAEAHDIAIINVVPSASEVYVGQVVNISVVVQNQGNFTETFQVTCKYELNGTEHIIGTKTVNNLAPQTNASIVFSWTTTDITVHTISANATILPDEADTADNVLTGGTVKVKMLGDINGDEIIDIHDAVLWGIAFGSHEGSYGFNPQADLYPDGIIDIFDGVIIGQEFGKTA